jgi:molybdopterin-containing oxidoreductase family membrane subunit
VCSSGRPYVLRDGFFIWPWTFFPVRALRRGLRPVLLGLVVKFMELLTGKKLVDWKSSA